MQDFLMDPFLRNSRTYNHMELEIVLDYNFVSGYDQSVTIWIPSHKYIGMGGFQLMETQNLTTIIYNLKIKMVWEEF